VAKVKEPFNPFYAVLLVAGIVFAVTASAYGVMAITALRKGPIVRGESAGARLLVFLDEHGATLLTGELILLGIATVGVIGWDQVATSRAAARELANRTADPSIADCGLADRGLADRDATLDVEQGPDQLGGTP
jgi:hypothetical protein